MNNGLLIPLLCCIVPYLAIGMLLNSFAVGAIKEERPEAYEAASGKLRVAISLILFWPSRLAQAAGKEFAKRDGDK